MKNKVRSLFFLLLLTILSSCKSWNCGCPMSMEEQPPANFHLTTASDNHKDVSMTKKHSQYHAKLTDPRIVISNTR